MRGNEGRERELITLKRGVKHLQHIQNCKYIIQI
jgi:hypothetical protein